MLLPLVTFFFLFQFCILYFLLYFIFFVVAAFHFKKTNASFIYCYSYTANKKEAFPFDISDNNLFVQFVSFQKK